MELFILFLIGLKTQEGGQSGMTAWSTDTVIIGVHTRAAIAPRRSPEQAPTRVRMRSMNDPDPHPL